MPQVNDHEVIDLDCPWCGYRVRFGLRACQGCHADVVYGATRQELTSAIKIGLVLGVAGAFAADRLVGGYHSLTGAAYASLAVLVSIAIGSAVAVFVHRKGKPRFIRRTAL
jgi:hypothetical protein